MKASIHLEGEPMTKAKKTAGQVTNDICASITDRILAALEEGTVPWRKPWQGGESGLPYNAASNRHYNGINVWNLHLAAQFKGYSDPRWLTFKQARAKGGSVRKGEKSETAIFWKVLRKEEGGEEKRFAFLKAYRVFNVQQCDGLDLAPIVDTVSDHDPIASGEEIKKGYVDELRGGFHHGGGRAFYSPSEDRVQLPKLESFESSEAYYSTLFHELCHSTGHRSRLAREEVINPARFGDHTYAREELVAEFGASFLCGIAGIERGDSIAQSAAYIAGWKRAIKNGPRALVVAAGHGERAARRVLKRETVVGGGEV